MKSTHQALRRTPNLFLALLKFSHFSTTLWRGYRGQMLHYLNELFGGCPGQTLHYFNELFAGYLGHMCTKWNCRAVMRSGSVYLYDAAACTLHDCFILKREDALRFVVILLIYIKRVMRDPCGFRWGCPAVRN